MRDPVRSFAIGLFATLFLSGCAGPAVLAGISAAASIAGATHSFLQVGEDIVSATAIACQALPAAISVEQQKIAVGRIPPQAAATPWYAALCNDLRPSNPNLNASSPAWVAAGAAVIAKK